VGLQQPWRKDTAGGVIVGRNARLGVRRQGAARRHGGSDYGGDDAAVLMLTRDS
jgi:hypothetical protein